MNRTVPVVLNVVFVFVVCVPQLRLASADDGASAASPDKQQTLFSFEKCGKLIGRPAGMPAPGPYYTCLVKMDKVEGFPFECAL